MGFVRRLGEQQGVIPDATVARSEKVDGCRSTDVPRTKMEFPECCFVPLVLDRNAALQARAMKYLFLGCAAMSIGDIDTCYRWRFPLLKEIDQFHRHSAEMPGILRESEAECDFQNNDATEKGEMARSEEGFTLV
jgi:hypothetical protein